MIKRDAVPRRTASRPKPYKKLTAAALWRMVLGIPFRKGGKLGRPTAAARRKARRTLWLRARTHLGRMPGLLGRLPGRLARWHWDRLWGRVPQPPKPEHEWTTTAPRPKAQVPAGPRYAVPAPSPTPTEVTPKMSTPHDVIADAFDQLANFEAQTAADWEAFLAGQEEMFTRMQMAYVTLADRARSGMGFDQNTADRLQDLAAATIGVRDMAVEAHRAFGYAG